MKGMEGSGYFSQIACSWLSHKTDLHINNKFIMSFTYFNDLSIYLSMALQPFFERWPFFSFFLLYTVPEWGIKPSQVLYLYTEQHKHRINAHRHPFFEWDSNPRPQRSSGRRLFCVRPRGHCHRLYFNDTDWNYSSINKHIFNFHWAN
jgi:hypothetical protein